MYICLNLTRLTLYKAAQNLLAFHLICPCKPLCTSSYAPSIVVRKISKAATRTGLSSCAATGPSELGISQTISALPERFVKLKQLALEANSGTVVWRNEDRHYGEGGMGRFESSENGTIMDFGSDHTYYNGCGLPPEEAQKQYILASSPAEILDLIELIEQRSQPSTSLALHDPGLKEWMASMRQIAAAATEGPWGWDHNTEQDKSADQCNLMDDEEEIQTYLGRLQSKATGACVIDLGACSRSGILIVLVAPSVTDARFMEEASPASILRLIARLKRAQVTPASPLYLRPPSALAAALDRAARGAPFPGIFKSDPSQATPLAIEQPTNMDRGDWLRGIEAHLAAAHPGAVLALIGEVEAAYGLTGGDGAPAAGVTAGAPRRPADGSRACGGRQSVGEGLGEFW